MKKTYFNSEIFLSLIFLLLSLTARAGDEKYSAFEGGPERKKDISFENSVIEGVGKPPLDSIDYLGRRADDGKGAALYRKKYGFREEIQKSLLDVGYQP